MLDKRHKSYDSKFTGRKLQFWYYKNRKPFSFFITSILHISLLEIMFLHQAFLPRGHTRWTFGLIVKTRALFELHNSLFPSIYKSLAFLRARQTPCSIKKELTLRVLCLPSSGIAHYMVIVSWLLGVYSSI